MSWIVRVFKKYRLEVPVKGFNLEIMGKKIYQEKVKITFIKEILTGYFLMRFFTPKIAKIALPGQFIMVECNESLVPLLRRPFSFHSIYKKSTEFEILFKIVGNGTKILSQKKVGETVNILGPLGNGFQILKNVENISILARGIGVAPFKALIEDALLKKIKVSLFFSAKEEKLMLLVDDLKDLELEIYKFIEFNKDKKEDSRAGKDFCKFAKNKYFNQAFTCGSKRFMRVLAKVEREFLIPGQVSLENIIACGIGSCLGCAIPVEVKDNKVNFRGIKYKKVCTDGPVFWINEVILN